MFLNFNWYNQIWRIFTPRILFLEAVPPNYRAYIMIKNDLKYVKGKVLKM